MAYSFALETILFSNETPGRQRYFTELDRNLSGSFRKENADSQLENGNYRVAGRCVLGKVNFNNNNTAQEETKRANNNDESATN